MRLALSSGLLGAVLLLTSGPAPAQGLPPTGFEVGEKIPDDLVLPSARDGRPTSLAELHSGKKTLLLAFASW